MNYCNQNYSIPKRKLFAKYTAKIGLILMLFMSTLFFGQTNPAAFNLAGGNFSFTTQTATNTAYPTNMQGWTTGTANITAITTAAPSGNQAMIASGAASTSGLSNLGVNGFNFLVTGTLSQVGSIAVALNSTGRNNMLVSWTAADNLASASRVSALALQYRVGTTGVFTTVSGTTYTSSAGAQAAAQNFSNIALPSACDNQAVVQLRWFYWEVSGTGGRDPIRLDNITVSSSSSSGAPTADGTITAGEYGAHVEGNNQGTNSVTWYNSWDTTNLYFGLGAANNNSTEAAVIYLDVNPTVPVNGGTNANGTNVAYTYDKGTVSPAFRADYVLYFKNSYYELRAANGSGGWNTTPVTSGLIYAQSGDGATQSQEIAIPWSALGGSIATTFNWSAYKMYDVSSSNNGIYGQLPANNPGGAQNVTAYTLASNRYYSVSSTTSGSSTLPFSRISYCQPIGTTTNGFGSAAFYDFTVNPGSGFQVARSATSGGDWTISGNLVVGSGALFFGSGGTTFGTSTIGNVNIVGGSINMDQTNVAMNIGGNLTIASGATLALSGTVGGDLNLAGNWNNSGTFTPNTRAVVFNGASAQTMTGATTFDFLTMNGVGGLTLLNNALINKTLTLTSGKITLGTNTLTVAAAPATISGGSSTSYIITNSTGALVRNSVANTATSFPVGLTASYTPLTVTNTGASNNLSLVVTSPPANAVFDATKIVNLEYNLNAAGTGAIGTIAFNWNTGNQGSSYTATGTGELGNFTAGPNYAITSIGTMAGQTKTVSGVALSSGNNKLVLGNTGAVYNIPPTNDNCSGATAITLDAAATTENVINATQSLVATCPGTANDDVWYSFTTTAAGTYTVTVVGSASFDAVVDVRSGACNGTNIFCADASASGGTETIIATGLLANTTYSIRVYDFGTGYPTNPTFTIAVTSPPAALSTNGTTTFSFGNQAPVTQSASQTFNLSGTNLTGAPGNITVTAPNVNFQVSNNNSTWGATTLIAYSSATLSSIPVYVRFTPQTSGTFSGNVTFSGGGTSSNPTIALTGASVLPATVAAAATNIAATSFDANWNAITGSSSGYLLDVSTSSIFGISGVNPNSTVFNNTGSTGVSGWSETAISQQGGSSPYLGLLTSSSTLISPAIDLTTFTNTNLNFIMRTFGGSSGSSNVLTVSISTNNGSTWTTLATRTASSTTLTAVTAFNLNAYTTFTQVKIRFQSLNATGSIGVGIDNITVIGDQTVLVPNFVTGYNAKPIAGQSTITSSVTGLTADTVYYYRLRATDGSPSAYSNVITVNPASRGGSVSANQTICSGTQPTTLTLSGSNGTVIKWQKSSDTAFTSPTDIANTSLTLDGATIGNLTSTTYFRAVVQSYSNPTAYSNYVTISVTQLPTYANLQYPASGTICQSGTFTAYGQVYQAGVTEAADGGTGITAQFGYSTTNTDPSTWTNWSNASFNVQVGNNDEYTYTLTPPSSGTFYYTFRYRQDTCVWLYGGYNGGFWNGTSNINGILTVNPNHTVALTSGSSTSVVCQDTAIATPIVYSVGGGATSAGVVGLPLGMTSTFSGGTLTLNGTPTVAGAFNYTVTTIGNNCSIATAVGSITVNGKVTPTFTAVAPFCSGSSLAALPTTSNNGITGTWSPALDNTATTTYTFTPSAGQCANPNTLTISLNTIGTINAINGITSINGESSTTYSITPVTNASCYTWSLPAGMSIFSSTGNEIVVNISNSFIGGPISVKANNACGETDETTFNVGSIPSSNSIIISGPTNVCSLTNATYSVEALSGASYLWTLPSGMTLNSPANSNTINVSFTPTFNIGGMSVIITTNSNSVTPTLTIGRLGILDTISGPTNLCGLTSATYSIPTISGATAYNWTLPANMTLVSGATTNTITVNITGNVTGSIVLQASGTCGLSPFRTLKVETNQRPLDISGPTSICGASTTTICNGGLNSSAVPTTEALYSIPSIVGATSYTWSTPTGTTIQSGQGTNSIKVIYDLTSFGSGLVTVASNTNCGTSATRTLEIGTARTTITGPTSLCDLTTATYSIPSTIGTNFMWTLPSCMTLLSGQSLTNNSITVAISGPVCSIQTLSVAITGSCGPTNSISLQVACSKYSKIQSSQNGVVVSSNIPVYADAITGGLGYRFKIYNTDGFVATIDKPSRYFYFNEIAGISYGKTYSVEVAIQTATSAYTDYGYGCPSTVILNGTKIQASQCGTIMAINLPLYADNVVGAIGYKFEISDSTTGLVISTINKATRYFYFNELSGFSFGNSYNVRVAVKNPNGTYSPFGSSCAVTLQNTKIQSSICGTIVTSTAPIYVDTVVGATGYKFEISNNLGTVIATVNKTSNFFSFNDIATVSFGATYQVRVAIRNIDNTTYGTFGPSCTVSLQTTQIQAIQCGTTVASTTPIYVDTVVGATGYKFEVSNNLGTVIATVNKTSNFFSFNDVATISFGATYQVRVAVKNIDNTTYGTFGSSCAVSLQTTQIQAIQCGTTVVNTTLVYADALAGATGYKFEISNNLGTVIATLNKTTRFFNFTEIVNASINTTYYIKVAPKNPDNITFGTYGNSCAITSQIQNTKVQASQCGITMANNLPIYADLVTGALGYRFEIANSVGTIITTIDKTNRYFYFNEIANLSFGETYTIKVAPKNPDGISYGLFGSSCNVTLQTSKIEAAICGTSMASNLPVYAENIPSATGYRFEISNNAGAVIEILDKSTRYFYFNEISGVTFGTNYSIRVAPKNNNGLTYGLYGTACSVSLQGTKIQDSQCGSASAINLPIYADNVVGATGYRFEILNSTGSVITTLDKTNRYFYLNEISGVAFGTDYYVRVAIKNPSANTYSSFGTSCIISTLKTKIQSSQCGTTLPTNLPVYADAVTGASGYKFEISNASGTVITTINKTTRYFYFNEIPSVVTGTTYTVRVALKNPDNSSYSSYGISCIVTIGNPSAKTEIIEVTNKYEFAALAYPNPFEDNFKLLIKTANEKDDLHIKIYDMLGKQVGNEVVTPSEIEFYEFGKQLASGVYNISISQVESNKTLRIIKR